MSLGRGARAMALRHAAQKVMTGSVNLAIRCSDGTKVHLKRVDRDEHRTILHLNSLPKAPENRTVPLIENIILDDDTIVIVMPSLKSFHQDPDFVGAKALVSAVHELMLGIDFMHKHNVAHQ
ncbi:hypothetical protein R3P38DRAFT_3184904 [Favolaschia claudopus]|uniref:Protein kinase domain-containing protein n=1 Tax=Favolaschia claudopus TaxID=2862362 RepID=A0AAW0C4Z6_9AGAR